MVLKATANDKATALPFVMMNFVGFDLTFADQNELAHGISSAKNGEALPRVWPPYRVTPLAWEPSSPERATNRFPIGDGPRNSELLSSQVSLNISQTTSPR
ncbi:hypothetical protein TNCV_5009411 [Trichonephila clavipes]|nr:hypothetical protein TNCV_5009411 [Trichonephila clavipes]